MVFEIRPNRRFIVEDLPHIWIDFGKGGGRQYILTTLGTARCVRRQGLTLKPGMRVHVYQEDADEHGAPGYLYGVGTLSWDEKRLRWTVELDSDEVKFSTDPSVGPANPRPDWPSDFDPSTVKVPLGRDGK